MVEACEPRRLFADGVLSGTALGTAGSYNQSGNTIAKAFDGNIATYVDLTAANGTWAGLDLGAAKAVSEIRFAPRAGWSGRMVGGRFQTSDVADFSANVITLATVAATPATGTLTSIAIAGARAARYVRYLGPAGSYGNVAEVQFVGAAAATPTPVVTSDPQLVGTPIGTAGSFGNSGNTVAKAFDGSLATYVDLQAANGGWAGLDLGAANAITAIRYAPRAGWAGRMVGGRFEASNVADFSSGVVTLATVTAAPATGVLTSVPIAASGGSRYVRYVGPNGGYGNVAEVQFFGAAPTLTVAAIRATLVAADAKLLAYDAATANKTLYPVDATGAAWNTSTAAGWTSGFYPGALWLTATATGDANAIAAARAWTAGLASRQYVTDTHDVGFQVFTSFGNGYKLTADPAYKTVLLNAAKSLSSRFNPTTGTIRSWGNGAGNQQVIIDNLMNLELLMWASKNGGESAIAGWSLAQIATSHADKTLANHVRADGSTFHVVEYDPATGAALDPTKYAGFKQAYSDASTWSRGQAWAIYGFTMMYRETHVARFLDAAKKTADYFVNHLPADGVPPADFAYGSAGVPFSTAQKDATAGAIAASALIELSGLVPLADRAATLASATKLLVPLTSATYLSLDSSFASLLRHGSQNAYAPNDAGFAYGDYYLIEALSRLLATRTA